MSGRRRIDNFGCDRDDGRDLAPAGPREKILKTFWEKGYCFLTANLIVPVRRDSFCAIMRRGIGCGINAEKPQENEFYIGFRHKGRRFESQSERRFA